MSRLKLKGGALFVSIIISILISIILSLFIVIVYYNTRTIQAKTIEEQLQLNLESGFDIAQSKYWNENNNNRWQKTPYNNDSIKIKKILWGCYDLIEVKTKKNRLNFQKAVLLGTLATKDTALYVTDQNKPIGLAGKIQFNGTCYLPKSGLKSAYIEGTSFSDLSSLIPNVKKSSFNLPLIDEVFLKKIHQVQTELNPLTDSLLSFIPDKLTNSFSRKTAVIQSGSIHLNSQILKDNIKLISANVITVEKDCQLENVLLVARKVIFKKNFTGTVQVIVQDSIITEDECIFNYPSSFCVYFENQKSEKQKSLPNPIRGIFFGKTCEFNGGLLTVNDKNNSSKMIIKLNQHFKLIGNLYSSNYCDIQGNLYGSIYCHSLLLQTPSAVYENHLLNCLIDSKKYSTNLVVPNWFGNNYQSMRFAKIL